jgi:1,4-alpha-glucan branching enzyme
VRIAGFEFAEGARFQHGSHPDANVVGAHIEMLREKFSRELTPEDVLDDAKNGNSPLHSFFEWNDGEAAHQHRLAQARGLIRTIVAVYVSDDKPAVRQRAYVNIKKAGEPRHYRELSHAMSQKDTRDIILRQAWREFCMWRQKYAGLKEFSLVFAEADKIAEQITRA